MKPEKQLRAMVIDIIHILNASEKASIQRDINRKQVDFADKEMAINYLISKITKS